MARELVSKPNAGYGSAEFLLDPQICWKASLSTPVFSSWKKKRIFRCVNVLIISFFGILFYFIYLFIYFLNHFLLYVSHSVLHYFTFL